MKVIIFPPKKYPFFMFIQGSVNALAWSRGGTALATGSSDQSVKVVDVVKKELIYSFDEVGIPEY